VPAQQAVEIHDHAPWCCKREPVDVSQSQAPTRAVPAMVPIWGLGPGFTSKQAAEGSASGGGDQVKHFGDLSALLGQPLIVLAKPVTNIDQR
jgi:hypothetical protein